MDSNEQAILLAKLHPEYHSNIQSTDSENSIQTAGSLKLTAEEINKAKSEAKYR